MQKEKPKFIAFEGLDGSGKSTQIKLLAKKLEAENIPIYQTFEPTDSPIGKYIRQIFSGEIKASEKTIAGLFVADRLNHLENPNDGIIHHLKAGTSVLCDRYVFSSYAYNSHYAPFDWVVQANSLACEILKPDVHIYIDLSPEKCFERIKKNRESREIYETLENLKKVQANYFKAFELMKNEENIFKVDGDQSENQIAEIIYQKVKSL